MGLQFARDRGMEPRALNDISYLIIKSAIQVHRALGPGLLESVYRACLIYELRQNSLSVRAEQLVPICYRGVIIDGAYRLDLLVDNLVVIEVKAIQKNQPVHSAQLLSYLRLLNKPLGLLINFHVAVLVTGIVRIMNGRFDSALQTKHSTLNQ